jgi:hypothetical protein
MLVQKLLAGLSYKITKWIRIPIGYPVTYHNAEKKLEETTEVPLFKRDTIDWYSETPDTWYKGPLILLEETQEGLKEYQAN